jgi:hypothetical protein
MFERFVNSRKPARGRGRFAVVSATIHAAAITALVVHGFWNIDKLPGPVTDLVVASAMAPPPPPPPAGAKRIESQEKSARKVIKEAVQPERQREFDKLESAADSNQVGEPGGEDGGQAGGTPGGSKFGMITDNACLGCTGTGESAGSPAAKRQFVPQAALAANLISGETQVTMPDGDLAAAHRQGKKVVTASVKLCLTAAGAVKSVDFVKRSGFSGYDAKIRSKMRGWKYRPFQVNGRAVPVCTAVNFRLQITK